MTTNKDKVIKSEIYHLGDIKVFVDMKRIFIVRNNEFYGENEGITLTDIEFKQIAEYLEKVLK